MSNFDIGGIGQPTMVDESSIVTNGLALCYDMSNSKTVFKGQQFLNDLTTNRIKGTFTGSVAYTGSNQSASVYFNTSSVGFAPVVLNNNHSVMVWYNPSSKNSVVPTGYNALITQKDGFAGLYQSNNKINFYDIAGTDNTASYVITSSTWNNVCFVSKGGVGSIYINGNFINGTSTISGWSANILGRDDFDDMYIGNIGMVLVYKRGLTNAEIKQNYNATRNRFLLPFVPLDLIPIMTGDTGEASCSSISGGGFEAWRAFDNNSSTFWAPVDVNPCWLQYQFPRAVVANSYYLDLFQTRTWGISGSNDGITWNGISTVTSVVNTATYNFANVDAYQYYRIGFTVGSVGVKTFQLYKI